MHPFQKYLGWVQRYFYHVEHGELPAPTLSLSIDQDWPLSLLRPSSTYTTIAGSQTSVIYTPDAEHHGLVFFAQNFRTTAGTFPATDSWALHWSSASGESLRLLQVDAGTAFDFQPLIGGQIVLGGTNPIRGIEPVYVPPMGNLTLVHTSVAGGIDGGTFALVLERLRSYPLRLP